MKRMSFRARLFLIMFIVAVLPVTIGSVFSYNSARMNLQNSIYSNNETFMQNVSSRVNDYFVEREKQASILSQASNIERAINLGGQNLTPDDFEYLQITLEANNYKGIFITDKKGLVVLSTDEAAIGTDMGMDAYVQGALGGTPTWMQLTYDADMGSNIMALAYPVQETGMIVGSVVIVIDQTVIDYLIHANVESIGQTGNAYIFDENGLLFSNTMTEDMMEGAALNQTIDTYATRHIGEAMKNQQMDALVQEVYQGYTGEMVLGAGSIVNCGDKPLGLIIEVNEDEAMAPVGRMRRGSMFIILIALILVGIVATVVSKLAIRPVLHITNMLKDIAQGEGDLTKRLEMQNRDEFGSMANYFNEFVEKLQVLVKDVSNNASSLSGASSEISRTIDESNRSLEEINIKVTGINDSITGNASVIEETNASVEEIASSANIIAEKAHQVSENAMGVLSASQEGAKSLKTASDSVEQVKEISAEMSNVMERLTTTSQQIDSIVDVITAIADQVNLLSLNAAIEAARAGEHGKGFAVVADEVRKLADDSKNAASDITVLVKGILGEVSNANASVAKEQEKVAVSVSNIEVTSKEFDSILQRIEEVADNVESISAMVRDQSKTTGDVSSAMDEITRSTVESAEATTDITANIQNQAAAFEEITASVEELSAMADALHNETGRFKID